MVEFPTFKSSWPWPWIGSYCTPSCITHRPIPTYQILLKSKKLFVDGRTYGQQYRRTYGQQYRRADGQQYRRTYGQQYRRADGHLRPTLLGRLIGVDLKPDSHIKITLPSPYTEGDTASFTLPGYGTCSTQIHRDTFTGVKFVHITWPSRYSSNKTVPQLHHNIKLDGKYSVDRVQIPTKAIVNYWTVTLSFAGMIQRASVKCKQSPVYGVFLTVTSTSLYQS